LKQRDKITTDFGMMPGHGDYRPPDFTSGDDFREPPSRRPRVGCRTPQGPAHAGPGIVQQHVRLLRMLPEWMRRLEPSMSHSCFDSRRSGFPLNGSSEPMCGNERPLRREVPKKKGREGTETDRVGEKTFASSIFFGKLRHPHQSVTGALLGKNVLTSQYGSDNQDGK
jgi:hypothetical protein